MPRDRSGIMTELRNPRTQRMHAMSVAECVRAINREDAAVIAAVRGAAAAIARFISTVEKRFCAKREPGRLIYLGAGTSGRLGVLDASEAPPTFQIEAGRIVGVIAGGDGALRKSSEGKEDDPDGARDELLSLKLTPRDTVLGIAAGGTTPWVIGAMRLSKQMCPRVLTGMLVCTPMKRPVGCDQLIVLRTGPEVLTGSTRMKAGTATKLVLNTISTTLMVRSGRVYENLMVDVKASNEKLRDRAARIVVTLGGAGIDREIAMRLVDAAGGSAKVAVVMVRRGVTAEAARVLLDRAGGRLHVALGEGGGKV